YQNKRLIVQHHIHELFNIPSITKSSPTLLREMLDGINSHMGSLKSQSVNTDDWDLIIIYLITSKPDFATKKEWESTLKNTELPNNINNNNQPTKLKTLEYSSNKRLKSHIVSSQHETISCMFCKQAHSINQCEEFSKLTVAERSQEIKKLKWCFNYLRGGHDARACKSTYRKCSNKHHTLLHGQIQTRSEQISNATVNYCNNNINGEVLLSTAVIQVRNKNNEYQNGRILLDVGSQQNFATTDFCAELGLECNDTNFPISGINQLSSTVKQMVNAEFKSSCSNYKAVVTCLVLPRITNNLPFQTFEYEDLPVPKNIKLADLKYYESAPNTHLGWIIGGPFTTAPVEVRNNVCNISLDSKLEHHFKRVTTGSLIVSVEEMYTLLSLIEAYLNSRPLIPLSNDPNDLEVLTPGRFLFGEALVAASRPRLRQCFWSCWQREYLIELQRRHKWQHPATSLKIGAMIIVKYDNLSPLLWRLGGISEIHPGADGIVRVVTIKTSKGTTMRGVNRVCVLRIEGNDNGTEVNVSVLIVGSEQDTCNL
ncbi:hypothetical protein ILUMI_19725, partial [Ignelater luminosus]